MGEKAENGHGGLPWHQVGGSWSEEQQAVCSKKGSRGRDRWWVGEIRMLLGPFETGAGAGTLRDPPAMGLVLVGREWLLLGEALPGVWPLHRGKGTGSKLMPDRVE